VLVREAAPVLDPVAPDLPRRQLAPKVVPGFGERIVDDAPDDVQGLLELPGFLGAVGIVRVPRAYFR
jgi:hypothetical protein